MTKSDHADLEKFLPKALRFSALEKNNKIRRTGVCQKKKRARLYEEIRKAFKCNFPETDTQTVSGFYLGGATRQKRRIKASGLYLRGQQ